jgi:hypothetical protein
MPILESPPLMKAIVTPAHAAVNGPFTRHNSRYRRGLLAPRLIEQFTAGVDPTIPKASGSR